MLRSELSELSESSQNYLKAVWSLQEWSDSPVTPSLVSEKTGMKLSTVSDAIRRLADKDLVSHAPYGAITLTEHGHTLAVQMVRRHRLIETFLVEMLGYSWDMVHDEAESLEHAVSDYLIERLDELLHRPARDPHGDPIPSQTGVIRYPDAFQLTEATPNTPLRIERFADDEPSLLQYFAEHGIGVGTHVRIEPGAPFSDALQLVRDGDLPVLTLGRGATDTVWVSDRSASA